VLLKYLEGGKKNTERIFMVALRASCRLHASDEGALATDNFSGSGNMPGGKLRLIDLVRQVASLD
jgi:hypothetical protein